MLWHRKCKIFVVAMFAITTDSWANYRSAILRATRPAPGTARAPPIAPADITCVITFAPPSPAIAAEASRAL